MNSEAGSSSGEPESEVEARHRARMQRLKAAHEWKLARATEERGLLVVNTGHGKGKTTAALGMIFRALGHDLRAGMVQFIKGAIATGEAAFARKLGVAVELQTLGEGYTWDTQDRRRDIETSRRTWAEALRLLRDPSYDLVVLDELNIVLHYDYLPLDEVLDGLLGRPPRQHVVVTGRHAKDELIEAADLVTEMKLIKHPYKEGVKPQRGVEY
jgi:cob(I)alamin adenosyltransferase